MSRHRPRRCRGRAPSGPSIALPVVSIVSGIPVTAIVLGITQGSVAGILVLIIAWVAIAAVNVAHGRRM